MPSAPAAPMIVAQKLSVGVGDPIDPQIRQQRLGDEPEPLRPAGQRADHGRGRHEEDGPSVVGASTGGWALAIHSRHSIAGRRREPRLRGRLYFVSLRGALVSFPPVRLDCLSAAAPISPPMPIDSTALLGISISAPFSFSPS